MGGLQKTVWSIVSYRSHHEHPIFMSESVDGIESKNSSSDTLAQLGERIANPQESYLNALEEWITNFCNGLDSTILLEYLRYTFPSAQDDLRDYKTDKDYVRATIMDVVTMIRKLPSKQTSLPRNTRKSLEIRHPRLDLSSNYNNLIKLCVLNLLGSSPGEVSLIPSGYASVRQDLSV